MRFLPVQKKFFLFFLMPLLILCYGSCQNDEAPETQRFISSQQQLEAEIELEKQNLEQQKKYLDDLKAQRTLQTQQLTQAIPSQITNHELQIQNLSDVLENLRLTEQDLSEAQTAFFREQSLALQLARDQLDPSISALEQQLQQIQQQITSWTNSLYALNSEQNAFVQNLKDLWNSQKQQLDQLNEQKLNISATALSETQWINQLSQQQRIELAATQATVQDQISILREEIEQLKTHETQYRASLLNLNQLISEAEKRFSEAEKNYTEKLKKIKSLESH